MPEYVYYYLVVQAFQIQNGWRMENREWENKIKNLKKNWEINVLQILFL